MSNTRIAAPGTPFRPERYCSSPEYERGLLANEVGRRCQLISDAGDREIVWFLQYLSHQEGGLDRVAATLLKKCASEIGTESMHRFGISPGKTYSTSQMKTIIEDLPCDLWATLDDPDAGCLPRQCREVLDQCQESANDLAMYLKRVCLDPATHFTVKEHWYFPTLKNRVKELLKENAESKLRGLVVSEIGRKMEDSFEFARQENCMVLVEGIAGIGKTYFTRKYCEAHPGQVRYVQVPALNDEISFFRAISKSLGLSLRLTMKAHGFSERIQDALQGSGMMLIFDEGSLIFPQTGRLRDTLPKRANWIMTALVNSGVPLAIVSTPQFTSTLRFFEKNTHWNATQWQRRVSHHELLPEELSRKDLLAIAESIFPQMEKRFLEDVADYSAASEKFLSAIDSVAKQALFFARKDGRTAPGARDCNQALKLSLATDYSIRAVLEAAKKRSTGKAKASIQTGLQKASKPFAESFQDQCATDKAAALVTV